MGEDAVDLVWMATFLRNVAISKVFSYYQNDDTMSDTVNVDSELVRGMHARALREAR